ncbi:MAG TPA: nucleotidyltransferase family protein [Candidatus Diapherotrites archaeon]|uniref:Nucleotidyltransferase family protein n=1 Tax=Candidatus Iainarchaeum sp. TaxID=3101447 RepID=A0A7J4JHX3_9ARCH|nr:hypothetical protein [Candidatus Diapherotrites archaeon]HIH16199.1 nucleotidyltransferase family protein [Candidatus Diapherotrites archaeon]
MPNIEELYAKELTDLSLAELKKFLAWCKARPGKLIPVVGGWAVYAYVPQIGSIDIDVVLTKQDEAPTRGFLEENGYKPKEDEPTVYLQEIGKITLRFDLIPYDSECQARGIQIPWNLLDQHSAEVVFQGQKMRVPTKELLLIQKVTAYRSREDMARVGHIRFPNGEKSYLENKIAKDKKDIKNLIDSGANFGKTYEIVDKLGFRTVFDDALKELGIIQTRSKTIAMNAHIVKEEKKP